MDSWTPNAGDAAKIDPDTGLVYHTVSAGLGTKFEVVRLEDVRRLLAERAEDGTAAETTTTKEAYAPTITVMRAARGVKRLRRAMRLKRVDFTTEQAMHLMRIAMLATLTDEARESGQEVVTIDLKP